METEMVTDGRMTPDRRWVRMLREYLPEGDIPLPQNPRILNIGCGNNVTWNYLGMVLFLAQEGLGAPRYVGVDIKEEAIAHARKKLEGLVDFVVGDARHLTRFLSGPFHLAVFEHPNLKGPESGGRSLGRQESSWTGMEGSFLRASG